jgi:hypothetical protein
MAMTGKNRIMIFGLKNDGTYVIEFRTAAGEALAISIPRTEAGVIRQFQECLPYGLFVAIAATQSARATLAGAPVAAPTTASKCKMEPDQGYEPRGSKWRHSQRAGGGIERRRSRPPAALWC